MSETRDGNLERMIVHVDQDLVDEKFVAAVMAEADRLRRRRIVMMSAAGVVVLIVIGLVASRLTAVMATFTSFIAQPIATVHGDVMATVLAPVNSLAGALGLVALGLWAAYRGLLSPRR
jgi:hypothetical protein